MNDLSNGIKSKSKLFSIFFVVHDIGISANDLNNDLEKTSELSFQWKLKFNADLTKQAH